MSKLCKKCGGEKVKHASGRWRCRPCEAAYQRDHYARNGDTLRARKANWMAKARHDPAKRPGILQSQRRAWQSSGRQKRRDWMKRLRTEEPWRWKALVIHTSLRGKLGADDLERMWQEQRGLCGLTGRPLDFETAQLDHVLPRSRGGSNGRSNLRWVCKEANDAKGNLTDEELLVLCRQVAEWIGRRILAALAGKESP
jgi:5-methylcytosine-specific restriction endonuclease McrA